jgi:septum formation inhibitor-activating ATPase MinD
VTNVTPGVFISITSGREKGYGGQTTSGMELAASLLLLESKVVSVTACGC